MMSDVKDLSIAVNGNKSMNGSMSHNGETANSSEDTCATNLQAMEDMTEMEAQATSLDSPIQMPCTPLTSSITSQVQSSTPAMVRSQTMPPGSRTYGSAGPLQCATTVPATGELNVRLGNIKAWSLNTYKCTKQIIQEKLGKVARTMDPELETKIELLRDTQVRYRLVLENSRKMTDHFHHLVISQATMGDIFSDMRSRQPELDQEFGCNAETQRLLKMNGDRLLGALEVFNRTLNTLVNQTMEDALKTVRGYEQARVEYDAYRREADRLASAVASSHPMAQARAHEAAQKFQRHKTKYDRLKADVEIKLRFLDENKLRVLQRQLLLFHNAISAYFSGNAVGLEATIQQFNIRLKTANEEPPSWLENQGQTSI